MCTEPVPVLASWHDDAGCSAVRVSAFRVGHSGGFGGIQAADFVLMVMRGLALTPARPLTVFEGKGREGQWLPGNRLDEGQLMESSISAEKHSPALT
ncbi:hypothetical protein AOLI_G00054310 [Acnodon oligacanthus]